MSFTTTKVLKVLGIGVGAIVGIAHIGILGHLLNQEPEPKKLQVPVINIPKGDYSSYEIDAGPDGYKIRYRANDPKILSSERGLDLDKSKKGFFGGGTEKRNEYRRDEYTMEGTRNIGGA
jgi:hypothetical protein